MRQTMALLERWTFHVNLQNPPCFHLWYIWGIETAHWWNIGNCLCLQWWNGECGPEASNVLQCTHMEQYAGSFHWQCAYFNIEMLDIDSSSALGATMWSALHADILAMYRWGTLEKIGTLLLFLTQTTAEQHKQLKKIYTINLHLKTKSNSTLFSHLPTIHCNWSDS